MTVVERDAYERANAEALLAAEVGERVRQAREAAGLSQRDLAARMGCWRSAKIAFCDHWKSRSVISESRGRGVLAFLGREVSGRLLG
jgi:hypothetical protein